MNLSLKLAQIQQDVLPISCVCVKGNTVILSVQGLISSFNLNELEHFDLNLFVSKTKKNAFHENLKTDQEGLKTERSEDPRVECNEKQRTECGEDLMAERRMSEEFKTKRSEDLKAERSEEQRTERSEELKAGCGMHAELQAVKSFDLKGFDVFVTMEPCPSCWFGLECAEIGRLFFGTFNRFYGACTSVPLVNSFKKRRIEVFGGIFEERARELIVNFFKEKRKNYLLLE